MYCIHDRVRKLIANFGPASLAALLSLGITHSVAAAEPSQLPLFLTAAVKPIVMLNMSNDHQLFFKAYDDYSDITNPEGGPPDGNADTTYIHAYEYYGYFDSERCYTYSGGRFAPAADNTGGRYCSGKWSGNFLNWATMTRIDAVRKILYGGLRQVDTATETVLERSFLPNDAHSFTKYYNGTDINKLTPFSPPMSVDPKTAATGITICNTTNPSNRSQFSQTVTDAPQMMVAEGNYSLWASNERWQCRWDTQSNGNDSALTGMYAHSSSPAYATKKLGDGNYNVRVKVCAAGFEEDNCARFGENYKPIGLLQEFGEDDSMLFGLMTGSYGKNKSGGVLRKNAGLISDEIKVDGTFVVPASGNSIIKTLDLLRVYGYDFNEGIYNSGSGDNCPWALSSFSDGRCSNWGNPQSEIYLESLRYLAGLTVTANYSPANPDSARIPGLNQAVWAKPVTQANYCAPLSVIQFNASTSSYDGDGLAGAANIGLTNLNDATNYVGDKEGIHNKKWFVGAVGTNESTEGYQLCTDKTVTSLSDVRGTCPDAPRLDGSYHIAGLAHHARRTGITVNGLSDPKKVITYGVALAAAVPKIQVPVPNSTDSITILPACRNTLPNPDTNCAIVDFKVIEQQTATVDGEIVNSGSLYVNWEDSEQGGDYDQDMWGIISYEVSSDKTAKITTQVIAQSTGDPMGFGYVIGGTNDDGFKVHSGVNGFQYKTSCTAVDGNRCTCRNSGTAGKCDNPQSAKRSQTYEIGTSAVQPLEPPLYYAAKWGGYSLDEEKAAVAAEQSLDDLVKTRDEFQSYFFATSPSQLEDSLRKLFLEAKRGLGVASSAATNSTRLNNGSRFYQASFNSVDWTGTLKAIGIVNGQLVDIDGATTDTIFQTQNSIDAGRNVLTYDKLSSSIKPFQWASLNPDQQRFLNDGDELVVPSIGEDRVNWIRGNRENESIEGGMRERLNKVLGDIVNSNPVYSGNPAPRNALLEVGGSSYQQYAQGKPKVLYVGANDGMLHAFDEATFAEIFAFVPNGVYPKLADTTRRNYGGSVNPHQYLMDGPLYVGDAFLNGSWRTVLVGSLGAGGRGVFALDVTNPNSPTLLFEFGPDDYPELGYVLGQPIIAPLKNGRWAAVFGNGYGVNQTSQLFVVDLQSPNSSHTKVIDTGAGTGLSAPALLPNLTGQVEFAYAGDLMGNIWKFNLDTGAEVLGAPLFVAKDEQNNIQPITGGLTLGVNELLDSAIMVYFGTGKYFDAGDNAAPAVPRHSFYAIADLNEPLTYSSRTDKLHEKGIWDFDGRRNVLGEKVLANGNLVSAVDWQTSKGWFLDFDQINGEKVATKPILTMDRLIFNTLIPSAVACEHGGRSFAMELIAVGDRNLDHSVLGENANTELDGMVVSEPSILAGLGGKDKGAKMDCNIKGDCEIAATTYEDGWKGRMNWREFR